MPNWDYWKILRIVTVYWVLTMFQTPCFIWIITMSSHLTDEENETVRDQVIGSERLIWVFGSKARAYNSFVIVPSTNYHKAVFDTRSACGFLFQVTNFQLTYSLMHWDDLIFFLFRFQLRQQKNSHLMLWATFLSDERWPYFYPLILSYKGNCWNEWCPAIAAYFSEV